MFLRLFLMFVAVAMLSAFLRPYVVGRCPSCGCFKASRSDNFCRECGTRFH